MSAVRFSKLSPPPNLHVTKQEPAPTTEEAHIHGFDEVTKNIDVQKHVSNPKVTEEGVVDIVDALHRGNWNSPIFENMDLFPLLALKAYKEGKIITGQFSTVMFYHSVRKHYPKEQIAVLNLFEMQKEINGTFKCHPFEAGEPRNKKSYLSKKKLASFYETMKKQSKDQQHFFVIKTLTPTLFTREEKMKAGKTGKPVTIKDAIQFDGGINVFCDILHEKQKMRMVPSFGMMQAFLDAFALNNPEGRIQLTPRIGLSSVEEIRQNGLTRTRDVGLHFIDLDLPDKADDILCPSEFEYAHHDAIYHGMVATRINRAQQKAFVEAYDILMGLKDNSNEEVVQTLGERLIDMEHLEYSMSRYRNNEKRFDSPVDFEGYMFFEALNDCIPSTYKRLKQKEGFSSNPDYKKVSKKIDHVFHKEQVLQKFVERLLDHPHLKPFTTIVHSLMDKDRNENTIYGELWRGSEEEHNSSLPFRLALNTLQKRRRESPNFLLCKEALV